jgi:hypothetical protein
VEQHYAGDATASVTGAKCFGRARKAAVQDFSSAGRLVLVGLLSFQFEVSKKVKTVGINHFPCHAPFSTLYPLFLIFSDKLGSGMKYRISNTNLGRKRFGGFPDCFHISFFFLRDVPFMPKRYIPFLAV